MTSTVALPERVERVHETPDVRVLARLVEMVPAELWVEGPLPGEDLEATVARRDAAIDILSELLEDLAAEAEETVLPGEFELGRVA